MPERLILMTGKIFDVAKQISKQTNSLVGSNAMVITRHVPVLVYANDIEVVSRTNNSENDPKG